MPHVSEQGWEEFLEKGDWNSKAKFWCFQGTGCCTRCFRGVLVVLVVLVVRVGVLVVVGFGSSLLPVSVWEHKRDGQRKVRLAVASWWQWLGQGYWRIVHWRGGEERSVWVVLSFVVTTKAWWRGEETS